MSDGHEAMFGVILERLSELEKKFEDQIGFNNALHTEIDTNIKEIAELREKVDSLDFEKKIFKELDANKKVLREVSSDYELHLFEHHNYQSDGLRLPKLKKNREKLDSKTEIKPELMKKIMSKKSIPMNKTEKKEDCKHKWDIFYDTTKQPTRTFWKCSKCKKLHYPDGNSGGEKMETEEEAQKEADAEEVMEVAQYLDLTSKPPEPICLQCKTEPLLIQDCTNKDRWFCPQCDYEWNKKDRLPSGTGQEPREDEPNRCVVVSLKNCMTCGEDLTNEPRLEVHMCGHCADKFGNRGYIGVKREDLQWLFKELEDWIHEYNDGLPKILERHLAPIKKLRDIYGLSEEWTNKKKN